MKKRPFFALFTALFLFLSLLSPAQAAPARDMQRNEITLTLEMQTLVNLALGAAVLEDIPALSEEETPSQGYVESIMALGLYSMALPYAGDDFWQNKATLSQSQLSDYYHMLFARGEYALPEAPLFPGASRKNDSLSFDLSPLQNNPVIGAHIYSTAFDGETVTLLCDLFTCYGDFFQDPQLLPEDALTWLCNARMTLQYAPETPFGYTVSSFSLSDTYLDGMISHWQQIENTEYEYSVTLPAIFGLAEDAPACMVWQTADGEATLTIHAQENMAGDYDAVLQNFLQDSGMQLTENRDFSLFTAVGNGQYELHLIPEGINWHYTLTLSFPPERQAEFTLYAEFICNSLTAWGAANG